MTIEGETLAAGAPAECPDCGLRAKVGVLRSAAGYYVGTRCLCGPYTRESGYYATESSAEDALQSGSYGRASGYVKRPLTRR